MGLSIPKINLSRSGKNFSSFDFSHDVNTTSDFCFVQPLMCKLLSPKASAQVKVNSFVRFHPLSVPTFGRVSWRIYHQFVRCADMFMPFENMLSGEAYNTSAKSYVPTSVPVISLGKLTAFCCANGTMDMFVGDDFSDVDYIAPGSADVTNARSAYANTYGAGLSSPTSVVPYPSSDKSGKNIDFDRYDFVFGTSYNGKIYVYGINLNKNGKHLRKILLGLGFQLDIDSTEKFSVLPLFAYYKAWYEIFNPQRTSTWTKTNAYKFLDVCRVNGLWDVDVMLATGSYNTLLSDFMNDLYDCYYTQDPDFVSAHISTPSVNSIGGSPDLASNTNLSLVSDYSSVVNVSNQQPYVRYSTDISQQKLNLLKKLYTFVNQKTVIGGKIGEYLRVKLGAKYIDQHESLHIGNSIVECQVGDVMSTNQSQDVDLGEYAGRGIGTSGDNNPTLHFTSDNFGYWVTLATIVPNSGYVQMVDPSLKATSRFTFYCDDFDGVGFEITNKSSVYGSSEVSRGEPHGAESFGYIPRYTGAFKIAPNVLNGDLSIRSLRNSYLPYTLDRFITPKTVNAEFLGSDNYKISYSTPVIPIASESWRYLGKDNYLGNLNRIFTSEDMNEDQFIIHNVIEMKVTAPMKSIADSFETQDADDKFDVSVEHA